VFGRSTDTATHRSGLAARGGVALVPILTGVVVAFGAMFLLSAIVGGVIAGLGYADNGNLATGGAIEAGVGAGIALVIAQFLSYLWGGYTAGRMGRGAGAANGFLVPLVALLVALVVGGVATMLGAEANLNLPFTASRLPLETDTVVDWGVAVGIASLVAMFVGGIVGGLAGARWHTNLERRAIEEDPAVTSASAGAAATKKDGDIDLRDDTRQRETASTPRTGGAAAAQTTGTTGSSTTGGTGGTSRDAPPA